MSNNSNNIVVFVDYSLPNYILEGFYAKINEEFEDFNLIFLNWNFLFNESFEITFDNIKSCIQQSLKNKKYKAFVGIGLGATILNLLSEDYEVEKFIYFSPILSKNYINPYTYFISTYKKDMETYYRRCNKEFFHFDKIFGDVSSNEFKKLHNWFIINEEQITKLISYISLIDQLKYLKTHETIMDDNALIILSEYDLIIDYKDTINYINKINKEFKKQIRFETYNNVKHWMIIESLDEFIMILKREIIING